MKKRTERKQKFSKIKFSKALFTQSFSHQLWKIYCKILIFFISPVVCWNVCPCVQSKVFVIRWTESRKNWSIKLLSIFASVTNAFKIGQPLSRDQRSQRHVQKGWKPIQRNRCWKTFPLMTTIPSAIVARFVKQKEKNCRNRYTNT